jgi:hypothetical protein
VAWMKVLAQDCGMLQEEPAEAAHPCPIVVLGFTTKASLVRQQVSTVCVSPYGPQTGLLGVF